MIIVKGQVEILTGDEYNIIETHQIKRRCRPDNEPLIIWGLNIDNQLTFEADVAQLPQDLDTLYEIILTGAAVMVIGVKRSVYTPEYVDQLKESIVWYNERGLKTLDVVIFDEKPLGLVSCVSDRMIIWGM